jgi:hypothetical protein
MHLENEGAAVEEYTKYVSGCPLFPKYHRYEKQIVIRNVPDSTCYKNWTKEKILSKYCSIEDDIKDYGDTWIVNITKNPDCSTCENIFGDLINLNYGQRDQQQIEGCCNTCRRLATAASVICGCMPMPAVLGGPVTQSACRFACLMFVETLKEDCENCCQMSNGTCWNSFKTWKNQFKKKRPDCPKPLEQCP